MPSSHLILCRPLLLVPSIFSSIRVFSNESALHIRRPKYWSFSFNIIFLIRSHVILISVMGDQDYFSLGKTHNAKEVNSLMQRGKNPAKYRDLDLDQDLDGKRAKAFDYGLLPLGTQPVPVQGDPRACRKRRMQNPHPARSRVGLESHWEVSVPVRSWGRRLIKGQAIQALGEIRR